MAIPPEMVHISGGEKIAMPVDEDEEMIDFDGGEVMDLDPDDVEMVNSILEMKIDSVIEPPSYICFCRTVVLQNLKTPASFSKFRAQYNFLSVITRAY